MATVIKRTWLTGLDDRVAQRLGAWLAVACVLTAACYWLGLRFPGKWVGDLLAARLASLGLVGAIATFQYGTWVAMATRTSEDVSNPKWSEFDAKPERDLLSGPPIEGDDDVGERVLHGNALRAWRNARIDEVSGAILPHNLKTLANYVASAYLLLVSAITDLLALLLNFDTALVGAVAAGTLLSSLAPFIDAWCRYTRALGVEFQGWETHFRQLKSGIPPEYKT